MRTRWVSLAASVAQLCLLAACAESGTGPGTEPAGGPAASPEQVGVPNLVGLDEGAAAKLLAAAGLVGQRRDTVAAAPAGQVVATSPAAGSRVEVASVVVYDVAEPAPVDAKSLGELVGRHPEAFVGLGVGAGQVPVVALNPGTDLAAWRPALDRAAGGTPYRTITCTRSWAELMRVQTLVGRRDWLPGRDRVALALHIDPTTCSVRLSSAELTADDIRTLTERHGDALTIETEGAVRDLGGSGAPTP